MSLASLLWNGSPGRWRRENYAPARVQKVVCHGLWGSGRFAGRVTKTIKDSKDMQLSVVDDVIHVEHVKDEVKASAQKELIEAETTMDYLAGASFVTALVGIPVGHFWSAGVGIGMAVIGAFGTIWSLWRSAQFTTQNRAWNKSLVEDVCLARRGVTVHKIVQKRWTGTYVTEDEARFIWKRDLTALGRKLETHQSRDQAAPTDVKTKVALVKDVIAKNPLRLDYAEYLFPTETDIKSTNSGSAGGNRFAAERAACQNMDKITHACDMALDKYSQEIGLINDACFGRVALSNESFDKTHALNDSFWAVNTAVSAHVNRGRSPPEQIVMSQLHSYTTRSIETERAAAELRLNNQYQQKEATATEEYNSQLIKHLPNIIQLYTATIATLPR